MVRAALIAGLVSASLTACAKEQELRVEDAYVRFSPVRGNPSAAYFTIHGGPQDLSLIGVSTEVAIRAEIHETMTSMQGTSTGSGGAMASMKPITSVQVPAGSIVKFEPGGKHVMMWQLNPGLKPPRKITLLLSFSNGEKLQVSAPLVAAGQDVPTE